MEKSCATEIQHLALQVVDELTKILIISEKGCSDSEYVILKKLLGFLLTKSK